MPARATALADRTLRSLSDLAAEGLVAPGDVAPLEGVAARYAIAITPAMARLIDRTDPADPIARQFVPAAAELTASAGERADPIGDDAHEVLPGLVHRYPDRVLLKLTHACPVYCRFCFRREMVGPGGEQSLTPAKLDAVIAYIAARPQIFEVIISGGDPLILAPRRIAEVSRRLAAIPHVAVLRWHSRVPAVAPERVTAALVGALGEARAGAAVFVGLHVNHARELTPEACAAVGRLIDAGIPVLSQTVLLRGVNDDASVLEALLRALVAIRVRPYYLHHMDLAPGTSGFRTTVAEGQALMRALRGRVSGLALPTYILDIPGGAGKVPIGPVYLDGEQVSDPAGATHEYRERG